MQYTYLIIIDLKFPSDYISSVFTPFSFPYSYDNKSASRVITNLPPSLSFIAPIYNAALHIEL